MISVSEAKEIIRKNTISLQPKVMDLAGASGLVLAQDVTSNVDVPAFKQSSMDGYAFCFADLARNEEFIISIESPAGNDQQLCLQPGEAARIFTGAPVPEGADTVVMQEKAIVKNKRLYITDHEIIEGTNVRQKGAEICSGALALPSGTILTPGAIGFLSGTGCKSVTAIPPPSACILVTGNELQKPGLPLGYGQVYDSNSFALSAALGEAGVKDIQVLTVKDNIKDLTSSLANALEDHDLILLTGGVSVGDYDFVIKAAENLAITKLFHKIKQRPGKPLYFGQKDNRLVFGLPGNPSSVLSCFYHYVLPAIGYLQQKNSSLIIMEAKLNSNYKKTVGLTHFLKGLYDGKKVTVLEAQESFRMFSFAKANCLIEIEEDIAEKSTGEMVKIYLLPNY